ncbi:MAG: hypothetical protein OJI70_15440 [Zavarzinia sp.]|nr:hypothetical protein [Zavarzinia sp.]
MTGDDLRSRRIAVVADTSLQGGALILRLEAEGWGLLQLPPQDLPQPAFDAALGLVLDQIEDYARHGYSIGLFLPPEVPTLTLALQEGLRSRGIAADIM